MLDLKGMLMPSKARASSLLCGTTNLAHFQDAFLIQIDSDFAALILIPHVL